MRAGPPPAIRRTGLGVLGALAALAGAGALAAAQPARPAGPAPTAAVVHPDATLAEPVMVTAASPRLWKLTRGASTVYVLGEIEPMPRGLAWNSAPLARAIRMSHQVLLPPEGGGGVLQALGALVRSRLANGATLEGTLPPDLLGRYRAVLARLGRDPQRLGRDKPAWAALFLELDFIRSRAVDTSEPLRTVVRLARAAHVPARRIAAYKAKGVLEQLVSLPMADSQAVLDEAVAGVDFGLDHVAPAGRAWASGDLRTARANLNAAETPLAVFLHTEAGRQIGARSVDDTAAALRSALQEPGVSVAVLRLAALVQPGGALDRLRSEGVAVSQPAL